MDRCVRTNTNGIVVFSCTSKALVEASLRKDNQCTTINVPRGKIDSIAPNGTNLEWCVCDTDGCNLEFNGGTLVHQPAKQFIVILAIASLINLVLN